MPNRRLTEFFLLVLPLIFYCAVIYYISSLPSPPTPDLGFDLGDKLIHAGAFGLMGLFAIRAARWFGEGKTLVEWIVLGVIFCTAYGALDELHQSYVPGRDADVMDWVADVAGAILAGGAVWLAVRYRWGAILFAPTHRTE
ncbi:MAG: VanZ family protein [Chlorobi bacterium]|nr:VanZ family protein [Chlorobiota bacterium]